MLAGYNLSELYPFSPELGYRCREIIANSEFSGTAVSILGIKEAQLIKSSEHHHSWRGLVNAKVAAMVDVVASCHNSGV